jgi:multisubunit Na+/H+ antiporter MnhB subunit
MNRWEALRALEEKRDKAEARADLVAYAFISLMLVLFQLMVLYTTLDSLITKTLYGIALALHADMDLMDMLIFVWHWIPSIILVAVIIWAIIAGMREEGDTYTGGRY